MCNSKTLFLITFLLLVQNSFTGSNLKHAETSNVKSSSPVPPKPESPQKLLENEYEKFLHSKQFQDDAKTEFTKLDTNKDGKLQFNEVSSTLSKFGSESARPDFYSAIKSNNLCNTLKLVWNTNKNLI